MHCIWIKSHWFQKQKLSCPACFHRNNMKRGIFVIELRVYHQFVLCNKSSGAVFSGNIFKVADNQKHYCSWHMMVLPNQNKQSLKILKGHPKSVNQGIDNSLNKRKGTNGYTKHNIKVKIEQHEPHKKI